jgi:hypothetical protein
MMKKRQRFEYKMQRRTKEKEVYFQYIQYEIGALRMIKLRREVKKTTFNVVFVTLVYIKVFFLF